MSGQSYTLMLVSDRSSKVQRFRVSKRAVMAAAGVAATLGVFVIAGAVAMISLAGVKAEQPRLQAENFALRAQLQGLQDELARIDTNLQSIDAYAQKVRAITMLSDPQRNLALGPVGRQKRVLYARGEDVDSGDENIGSKLAMRLLRAKSAQVHTDSEQSRDAMDKLHGYFQSHAPLLPTTPSIRPLRSKLVTSGFGPRVDPYTNKEVMHKGLDIAAEQGAEVFAPADGRVLYAAHAGPEHGKKLVLDHGFGTQTHYAHLAAFVVEPGATVRRGDLIARVGNTGRTTGSHLHYEVRQNGIPQDPQRFIVSP